MTVNDTKLSPYAAGGHGRNACSDLVYQDTARAVHWFNCVILFIDHSCIHVVFVMIPVSGSLPELAIQDDRSGNLYITSFFVDFSPVIKQGIFAVPCPSAGRTGIPDLHLCIMNRPSSLPSLRWSRFFASSIIVMYASRSSLVANAVA